VNSFAYVLARADRSTSVALVGAWTPDPPYARTASASAFEVIVPPASAALVYAP
jgi:hypothetical protein